MTLLKLSAAAILSLPALALAQAPDPCATAPQTCATTISTRATAQTRIPNTAVDISVAINTTDKDLPTVQRALSQKSSALLAYLRTQKAERLMTNGVNFIPEVKSQKNAIDKTVGFTGNTSISFRTTPEKAPELLAGVLDHGASNINSTSFTPTEEEYTAARNTLSAEATRTAITQAEAIAKAAGMHVVAVRTINVDNTGDYMPRPMEFAMKMSVMAGAPAPIETASGDQALTVGVGIIIAAAK